MAMKAFNDLVGPDGLLLTLLVFGALPLLGLPADCQTASTFQRTVALKKATTEMSKHFASRKAPAALNTRKDSDVSEFHKAPIGSSSVLYRPE